MKYKFEDIAEFNPKENIKKGTLAKKIAMEKLQPFCRDIPDFCGSVLRRHRHFRGSPFSRAFLQALFPDPFYHCFYFCARKTTFLFSKCAWMITGYTC